MTFKLLLKAAIMTLLIPGTVIFLVPYFILHRSGITDWPGITGVSLIASITGLVGLAVLLHCIWEFAARGKGTLAPIDPPTVLVIHGLYKYTRNPMYLAVIVVLLSQAMLFDSFQLLIYAAGVLLGFHLFIILYEEPHLRSRFGKSYDEYVKTVHRWRITSPGFKSGGGSREQ